MPTATNADDGELTEVEDVEVLGEIVHLCLQHRIQEEITNSSLTKIPHILYRLLIQVLMFVASGRRRTCWYYRTVTSSSPTTQSTQREYQCMRERKLPNQHHLSTGTYVIRCRWDSRTDNFSLPTTQNTRRDYQFIAEQNTTYSIHSLFYTVNFQVLTFVASWRRSKMLTFPDG